LHTITNEHLKSTRLSEAHKARISQALKGKKSPNAGKFSLRGYTSAEARAKYLIFEDGCMIGDETCKGRIEMTFWHDNAPEEWVRIEDGTYNTDPRDIGRPYWVGPAEQITEAYRWLCASHHHRTDPAHDSRNWQSSSALMMRANRPKAASEGSGYGYIHKLARRLIGDRECIEQDETCKGKVYASLNLETPTNRLRADPRQRNGGVYSIEPADYDPLCQSHAQRRDLRGA